MSSLTRDGMAEPLRDQILRHARGQGNVHFPCSANSEQDWQPYPVDPYSAICDDHTYIHTYIHSSTYCPEESQCSHVNLLTSCAGRFRNVQIFLQTTKKRSLPGTFSQQGIRRLCNIT